MKDLDITPEFKKQADEHFHKMEDNTQVDYPDQNLRFVKMSISQEHIAFVMQHYNLNDVVELNQAAFYLLRTFALMETDGFKFSTYNTEKVDGKEVCKDVYGLDIHLLIKQLLDLSEE